MEEAKFKFKSNLTVSVIAMAASVAAFSMAFYSMVTSPQRITNHNGDYLRVVQDLWAALEPIYQDYGLDISSNSPSTIQEAIGPLVRASTALSPSDEEQSR